MDDKETIVSIAKSLAKHDGPGTARMMDAFLQKNQDLDPAESGYAPADGVSPDTVLALMEIARECWNFVCVYAGPTIEYTVGSLTIYKTVWPMISGKSTLTEDEAKELVLEGLKKAEELKRSKKDLETQSPT
ncbi:hypothetical protein [Stappia indica]|jgi:hypothetical protein|uniref:Uncharacterized protein n=1 Tax=Stappia indica TaxID=538381 RepID=A0A857CD00_9HYPH|nr:hypothetical protein [Stappia indica]QGZ36717.1 hypothetical protein GH266_20780 [Stappia indica]